MDGRMIRVGGIGLLAAIFTVGLAFATVELPYLVDGLLQESLTTPGGDSHADDVARLKTELFIAHFHLRAIGYVAFFSLLGLIAVGFARRSAGLAALGALGVMLTVFAQFASVMFFLAGLGALNVLWLPVLDLSFDIPRLGLVIRAPYDAACWVLEVMGVENCYWPVVLTIIGSGLLIFFLGTLAWLGARARKEDVATGWVYRFSRHPQYLGWILWTYGVYLLLLRGQYPRRSWGIDASLPWVISTMVIIGVALLEEMNMRRHHGEAYESYRRRAPFLFPVPGFIERLALVPLRLLFHKERFERPREVAAVLGLYTGVIMAVSAFFYGTAIDRAFFALSPSSNLETALAELAQEIRDETQSRSRYFLALRLAAFGEDGVPHLLSLLQDGDPGIRSTAAEQLSRIHSPQAIPHLVDALDDPHADVRGWSVVALRALRAHEARAGLTQIVEGERDPWPRNAAITALAALGAEEAIGPAIALLEHPDWWMRIDGVEALGASGSKRGLDPLAGALQDESVAVRRAAVIAVLQIGSSEGRPLLEAALQDHDWEVRLYAEEALKRIPGDA